MTLKQPSAQSYSWRAEAIAAGVVAAIEIALVAFGVWWFA